jgi:hypothetical protein
MTKRTSPIGDSLEDRRQLPISGRNGRRIFQLR